METVSDADGKFSFANLEAATYTLAAYYDTDNTNNAGRFSGLRFTNDPVEVVVTTADVAQDLALASTGQAGLLAVNIDYAWDAGTSAYVQNGTFTYDATHSPIEFEFQYRNGAAEFMGAFSQVKTIDINFDPANPSSGSIFAEVDLLSFDTRSPGGRDPISTNNKFDPTSTISVAGCMLGPLGVTADGPLPSTYTSANRYASFTSTSISAYGDGYMAKGNLVFKGVTKAIEMWFKETPTYVEPSNNRTYATFEGRFFMNAKSDFDFSSTSLNDAAIRMQISIIAYQVP
jgi:polyisoprenoid-binding protein YceI